MRSHLMRPFYSGLQVSSDFSVAPQAPHIFGPSFVFGEPLHSTVTGVFTVHRLEANLRPERTEISRNAMPRTRTEGARLLADSHRHDVPSRLSHCDPECFTPSSTASCETSNVSCLFVLSPESDIKPSKMRSRIDSLNILSTTESIDARREGSRRRRRLAPTHRWKSLSVIRTVNS